MKKVDLHMHSTASDGSDPIPMLRDKIIEAGLSAFAVTDHDTIDGAMQMKTMVPAGVRFYPGIEFSCESPVKKCHILGYCCDERDPAFQEALELGRTLRQDKLERRLTFLKERFGIVLTGGEMDWLLSHQSPGKPHLGRILLNRGMASTLTEAIETYVSPCKGGKDRIPADVAISAILHAGGVPVWAHPLGGEGERRLTGEEVTAQLKTLAGYGIRGLECFYSRYTAEESAGLRQLAEEYHLLVSGGSDYHGKNKVNITLGKLNDQNAPIDPENLTILTALG